MAPINRVSIHEHFVAADHLSSSATGATDLSFCLPALTAAHVNRVTFRRSSAYSAVAVNSKSDAELTAVSTEVLYDTDDKTNPNDLHGNII